VLVAGWVQGRHLDVRPGSAVDASGNVYYMVGNGDWNGSRNFGESMVKFGSTPGMPLLDWFTPDSWSSLNAGDVDYGSSGPISDSRNRSHRRRRQKPASFM